MRDTILKGDCVCVCVCVCLCLCSSCNCSTVAMRQKSTASIGFYSHVLLDFDSWICKLKLCSRVMATLTYSEGCCCLFRILCSIICPHKLSIQPMSQPCTKALAINFVSYKSQEIAAMPKYSQCQKAAIQRPTSCTVIVRSVPHV